MRVVGVITVFLTLLCYVPGTEAQDFVTDGLVAMYTLNVGDINGEVVKDVFASNDARLVGQLNFVDGAKNGTRNGLEFKGEAGNYVEIPPLGNFDYVSIECYALEKRFVGTQGIVSTWQWAAGTVHFKFENNQVQVHKNDGINIRLNVEAETWYHIIYTSDTKRNRLKLYVNGELVGEGPAGFVPENMNARRIGSEHGGGYLIGIIDNVRIYDRILKADEVKQNFESNSDYLPVEPAGKLSTTWGTLKRMRN